MLRLRRSSCRLSIVRSRLSFPRGCVNIDPSTSDFLDRSGLSAHLTREQSARLGEDAVAQEFKAGACVRPRGAPSDAWLGIASGAVRIENTSADGRPTTLTQFTSGCWFGEDSLLNGCPWPFDAIATSASQIVLIPITTFEWLLDTSLPFNRFLLGQFNARLSQFVERCEHVRLHDADHHVAHCLVEMIDPRLHPAMKNKLAMSQEGLARLAGVSRSVVNRALQRLERQGWLKVKYRSITLIDAEAIRRFSNA